MSESDRLTDGQRIAAELAQIRELLHTIAGCLFQIAGDSEQQRTEKPDGETYMDGSPIR